MSNSLNKEKLDSILRVDHAGETAAAKIYDGQLAILKYTPVGPPVPIVKNSADFAIEVIGLDKANVTKTAEIIDIIFFI